MGNAQAPADPTLEAIVEGVVMSDFVWFPVTGTGSQASPLVWNSTPNIWSTGSFWVDTGSSGDTVTITNPATLTTGTVPGPGDNVGLIAGTVSPTDLATYNSLAPSLGDPIIGSSYLPVDVLINSGTVSIASLALAGFGYDTGTVTIYPTLDVEGAVLKLSGSILNTGTAVFPSPIGAQTLTSGGTIDIGSGASMDVAGSVDANIDLNFSGGTANVLSLDAVSTTNTTAFAGTVGSFGAGDTILLPNIPSSLNAVTTTGSYDTSSHVLTVSVGGGTAVAIDLTGSGLTASNSVLVESASSGVELVTCFAAGTLITTQRGDVPVETLLPGDPVITPLREAAEPVVWIGRRRIDCRRHPAPHRVWPVRIRAGAFGPGQPYRDLLVSPNHAIYADGVLIPARCLVNGSTVQQVEVEAITYYHVELPQHDVLLANGLAVESYLEANDRGTFANIAGPTMLHPDLTALTWEGLGCAPLVMVGSQVDAVRARLGTAAEQLQVAIARAQ